jgi:hypothetical protein
MCSNAKERESECVRVGRGEGDGRNSLRAACKANIEPDHSTFCLSIFPSTHVLFPIFSSLLPN